MGDRSPNLNGRTDDRYSAEYPRGATVNGNQADVDALAAAVEHTRVAWHRARQHRDDVWRACQEAVREELLAAEEHARAVAAHNAERNWR